MAHFAALNGADSNFPKLRIYSGNDISLVSDSYLLFHLRPFRPALFIGSAGRPDEIVADSNPGT